MNKASQTTNSNDVKPFKPRRITATPIFGDSESEGESDSGCDGKQGWGDAAQEADQVDKAGKVDKAVETGKAGEITKSEEMVVEEEEEEEEAEEEEHSQESAVKDTQTSGIETAGAVLGGLAAGASVIPVVGNTICAVLGALATVLKAGHIDEITRTKCREVQQYLNALSDSLADDPCFGQTLIYRQQVENKFKELELIVTTILHRDEFDRVTSSLSKADLEKIDVIRTDLDRLRNEELHEKGNLILQKLNSIHGSLVQGGAVQTPTEEQRELLNFLRFATILVDELPVSMRALLQRRWAVKYPDHRWSGETCWEGTALDVALDVLVQCVITQSKKKQWCKLRSATPLKGRLVKGDKVEIRPKGNMQSGLIVINTKDDDGDCSVVTLNKLDKFEGNAEVFTQQIKHERNAPTQMKAHFARKMRADNIDEWDISLLMFLLCNSSHTLLDSNDPKDRECLKVLGDLRDLRNVGFGHTGTCRLSDDDLKHNISVVMRFAESSFNGGDDLKARINKVTSTDFPIAMTDADSVLARAQNWEIHFDDVCAKVDAVGEVLAEVDAKVGANAAKLDDVGDKISDVGEKVDALREELKQQGQEVSEEDKALQGEILALLEGTGDDFQKGRQCFKQGLLVKAKECFEKLLGSEGSHQPEVIKRATVLFILACTKLGVSRVKSALSCEDYEEAAGFFEGVLQKSKEVPEGLATDRLQRVKKYQACCLYECGKQHLEDRDWHVALDSFEAARKKKALPNEQKKKNTAYITLCRNECREARNEVKRESSLENDSESDDASDDAALKLYKEAKAQLRGGNIRIASDLFSQAQGTGLSKNMELRADEYREMIEQLNEKEQAEITTCVFKNATHTFAHTLTLGLSATQLLSTLTIAALPNDSKAMSVVLNKEFPPDSEERAKLIVLLKLDIRKALGKLVEMSILDLGKGSIVILFCFVPQQSQTADDMAALEAEYLKQVEDGQSELRSGELTRSIDAVRTKDLTTQLNMSVNRQRACPYKPGKEISFSSVGDHRKNCEIVSVLGKGASATVFKVKILADGRACALKVFNTENHLLELSREASLLLTLNHPESHPNVIGIDLVWYEQSKNEMFFSDGVCRR
jgi:tetratricopeptide (TPR) repeat protein